MPKDETLVTHVLDEFDPPIDVQNVKQFFCIINEIIMIKITKIQISSSMV